MHIPYRFCISVLFISSAFSLFGMNHLEKTGVIHVATSQPEVLVHMLAKVARGPACLEMIQDLQQKRPDFVGAAQRDIEICSHVPANADLLNAFLDLGVRPYEGWHVGRGYIWGSSYEVSHFESRGLCNNLIALKNFNSLGKILAMNPSFATKNILLRAIAQCEPENFAQVDRVQAACDAAGKRYRKLPHAAYLEFTKLQRTSFDHARWTIEFARWALAHNYDLNSPKRKMGGKTFFDLVANTLFHRYDLVGNGVHFKDLLVFLLDNQCTSNIPELLVELIGEKIQLLGRTHPIFQQKLSESSQQFAQSTPEYKMHLEILNLLKARLLCPEIRIDLGKPMDV